MSEYINVFVLIVGALVSMCVLLVCLFVLFVSAFVFLSRPRIIVCCVLFCHMFALLCIYFDVVLFCVQCLFV